MGVLVPVTHIPPRLTLDLLIIELLIFQWDFKLRSPNISTKPFNNVRVWTGEGAIPPTV